MHIHFFLHAVVLRRIYNFKCIYWKIRMIEKNGLSIWVKMFRKEQHKKPQENRRKKIPKIKGEMIEVEHTTEWSL